MNLRKPLLAIMAGCVLLGLIASSASASSGQFLHSKYPNSLHADLGGNGLITVEKNTVACTTEELNGATQNGPTPELVLTPTYSGCTAFGNPFSSTFNVNGCTYRLTQTEGAADTWAGGFAIKCPEGKKIVIESTILGSTCKVEIGEQTLASGVAYKNDTAEGGIDFAFNLSSLKVTKAIDNGSCQLNGTGIVNNGTYTGGAEAEAASEGTLSVGASGGQFLHSKYPNSAHAVQAETHVFKVDGQEATCKTVELNGATQNGPAFELTLTPTYKECTVFGFANSSINANGCTYLLTQPGGAADSWEGGFQLKCPAGKKIVIEATPFGSTCKVEIGEQTPTGGVSYENDTAEEEVDLTLALSGVKSTTVTDNGSCPLNGTGERNNSTYGGGSTAAAASGGGTVIAASGAGQFLHSKYPNSALATLNGNGQLTVDGQKITCKTEKLTGATQNGAAAELTLTPTYENCTAFGFGGATVTTNGCTYKFTQPEGVADNWAGGFALNCPAGKKIVIEVTSGGSTCKVEIGEQTPAGIVSYGNDTAEAGIDFALNVSGINVTKVTDNGECPLSGTGTVNNGTYTGGTEAKAASGGSLSIG